MMYFYSQADFRGKVKFIKTVYHVTLYSISLVSTKKSILMYTST